MTTFGVKAGILLAAAMVGFIGGAYESALLASSRATLKEMADSRGDSAANFLSRAALDDDSVRLRAGLLHVFGLGIFLLYGGLLAFPAFMPGGSITPQVVGIAAALLLVQLALTVAANMVGEHFAERFVVAAARPVAALTLPMAPLVWLLLRVGRVTALMAGFEENDEEEEREADVKAAVMDGAMDGVVEAGQKEMIEGIFDFKDADVADVFVPRTAMTVVDARSTLTEAVHLALEKGYSRLPAFRGNRDHIVGVFHIRDALAHWDKPESQRPSLTEVLREPLFVPETKKVSELLAEMRRGKSHMAVVLDEYGGTAGLVTIEDVIEEIVGEITDEFDAPGKDDAEIRIMDGGAVAAEGHVHVADVNKALGDSIIPEDDDYETVAGFVLDNLGHIPAAGEGFVYDGKLEVKVLVADERRVKKVRIRILDE